MKKGIGMCIKQTWLNCIFFLLIPLCSPLVNASSTAQIDNHPVINKDNDFAFDFYKQIYQTNQNVVISPYILSPILGALLEGAAGNTFVQLSNILHLDHAQDTTGALQTNRFSSELTSKPACDGWFNCTIIYVKNKLGYGEETPVFYAAMSIWAADQLIYKPSLSNWDRWKCTCPR